MNTKVLPNRRAVGHAKPLRIVSRRAKSYASIAPYYVIALSQTDTVEQERWMAALAARTKDADRRSPNDVRVRLASPKKRHKV